MRVVSPTISASGSVASQVTSSDGSEHRDVFGDFGFEASNLGGRHPLRVADESG
ncbi:hypothetical protein [Mycobacterium marinum]|uniref:hypothetical protein n=1 Tax=Mycobacterium marinum TaxID=1781 RepID=UPI0035649E6D